MTQQNRDRRIAQRWLIKSLSGDIFLAVLLFVSAGTARWPMAWALVVLFAGVTVATYLLVGPALIAERERNRRSTETWDNILLATYGVITMLVVPVVAGFDKRYGWSPPFPPAIEVVALLLNIAAWALHIWAMRANAFFVIVVRLQEERGQTVASGGPYRWVRHPGYAGGIGFNLATPIMLGSLWALVPGIVGAGLLVVRTYLEDRLLQEKLPGYSAYTQRVRHRLIPGGW